MIEATRLADALAALRGRPLAGLEEVTQAAQAVLADGSDLLLALIQRKLVVGERLGAVPPATPMAIELASVHPEGGDPNDFMAIFASRIR